MSVRENSSSEKHVEIPGVHGYLFKIKPLPVHFIHVDSAELYTVCCDMSGNDNSCGSTDLPQIFGLAIWEVLIN